MEQKKSDALKMIDALENAQIEAANLGYDGIWYKLADLIKGLAKSADIDLID